MKNLFTNRLTNKLFLLHIGFTVILLGFFITYNHNQFISNITNQYDQEITHVNYDIAQVFSSGRNVELPQLVDHLMRDKLVEAVAIYDSTGTIVYSKYENQNLQPPATYSSDIADKPDNYFVVNKPIHFDHKTLGYTVTTVSKGSWLAKISNNSLFVLIFIISLSLFFLILSYFYNKNITRPVATLTSFARKITHSKNYSERITLDTNSEIRTLSEAFNKMLEQIENHQGETQSNEQIIRDSEERYRMLFELAGDAIFLMDKDIFIDCNSATLKIFGCDRNKIIGEPPYRFSPPKQPDGVSSSEKAIQKIRSALQGEVQRFEWRHCKLDGNEFDTEVTLNCITLSKKKYILAIVRDITVRKKRELEEQKLEKLQSVGLLAGGIAHDFNNFLTGILGSISLAMMDLESSSDLYLRLQEAEHATIRARDLTQQLLTFSRGGEPIKESASITKLINDTVSFSLRGSNVDYHLQSENKLATAKIDTGQISQVIQNLTINAKQAMPDGGTITITIVNHTCNPDNPFSLQAGKYLKIVFEDQGIGIPKKFLQKIFDPYFSTKQNGNGLGLATCHSIIKKHGGHIEADSVPGEKTIFIIYLPTSEEQIPTALEDTTPITKGEGKILVMDDEPFIRDLAEKILKRYEYEVVAVADGKQAVTTYQQAMRTTQPFTLVLLDLTVPGGMGGFETLDELKKIDPDVVAIVCSGYSNDRILSNHEEYGFKAMVSKPYRPADLVKTVQQVLHSKEVQPSV